jgi:hypothetical protein
MKIDNKDLIAYLKRTFPKHEPREEDFLPEDHFGGNIDDAYYGGTVDGQSIAAWHIIEMLEKEDGGDWHIIKTLEKEDPPCIYDNAVEKFNQQLSITNRNEKIKFTAEQIIVNRLNKNDCQCDDEGLIDCIDRYSKIAEQIVDHLDEKYPS